MFSCDAHENITMFGDVAIQLIKMMGHSGTVPSAIVADDVPSALTALKTSLKKSKDDISLTDNAEDDDEDVSLSNRAWPLIALLEDAAKAKSNVMWREA